MCVLDPFHPFHPVIFLSTPFPTLGRLHGVESFNIGPQGPRRTSLDCLARTADDRLRITDRPEKERREETNTTIGTTPTTGTYLFGRKRP